MKKAPLSKYRADAGFSLIELLVVVAIIAAMAGITIFYATSHKKAYQADDQVLQIADVLQEGRQRALTQRRTMRVEINMVSNTVKLYDENLNSTSAADDVMIKSLKLFDPAAVKVDSRPTDIAYNPAEPMPVPTAVFKNSVYTPTISQNVCTIRFLANGTVVDAGNDAIGTGAVPTGVTLHVWMPKASNPAQSDIARSITILGPTGVIRAWEFDPASTALNKWEDSRRAGTY